jgi:hypothetical protein
MCGGSIKPPKAAPRSGAEKVAQGVSLGKYSKRFHSPEGAKESLRVEISFSSGKSLFRPFRAAILSPGIRG